MKIPKCKKSLSGKHDFPPRVYRLFNTNYWVAGSGVKCAYCGLVDDRPSTKEEVRLAKLKNEEK